MVLKGKHPACPSQTVRKPGKWELCVTPHKSISAHPQQAQTWASIKMRIRPAALAKGVFEFEFDVSMTGCFDTEYTEYWRTLPNILSQSL